MAYPSTTPQLSSRAALKQQIKDFGLNSDYFLLALQEAVEELRQSISRDDTEATIAGYFERILYDVLKDIDIKFNPKKEDLIETQRHIGKGRMDSRLGAVVIEYKRPSKFGSTRQIESAIDQLKNYLISLSQQDHSSAYGFLTNGITYLEIFALDGVINTCTKISDISTKALLNLTKSIRSLDLTALTPENLIRDFCGNNGTGVLFDVARTLFSILGSLKTPKTIMLQSEWEEIFRLGVNDHSQQRRIQERKAALSQLFQTSLITSEDEYRALFALHTAYALIVKLMAYRVVSDLGLSRQPSNTKWNDLLTAESDSLRAFCEGLEDGEIFRVLGVLNLLEGDFFSWYSDRNQWNDQVFNNIKAILHTLGRYEQTNNLFSSSIAVDLFRELYEAAIPQPVRSSFGEFYTPHWLAHHLIDSADPHGEWRLLDPCSGSGTIIIAAIEKIRQESIFINQDELLTKITKRVVAIDLNPLAVLTTRVNYFVHISDLITDSIENLVIPVFLGDASNIPSLTKIQDVGCISYSLRTLQDPVNVTLPLSIVKNTPSFVLTMLNFEKAIISQNKDKAIGLLIQQIPEHERIPEIIDVIDSFTSQLIDMGRNIWQSDSPIAMIKAVKSIVHENFSIKEASDLLMLEKKIEIKR